MQLLTGVYIYIYVTLSAFLNVVNEVYFSISKDTHHSADVFEKRNTYIN